MNYINEEAPNVKATFYAFTNAVSDYAPFSEKQKELILIAVFAAKGADASRGLGHHIQAALQLGATKEEVIGSILLIAPVVGITLTTAAVDIAHREILAAAQSEDI